MPALILVGEADRLIAPHHSERLASLWAGPVERVALPGFGHNDVSLSPRYARAVHAFLDSCNQDPMRESPP
jgi:pimeloyl-ACP methyl ester carboxylesterase